ncbi:MAG TPA: hypothetical protein VFM18_22670 [Methanosarcina sp.]|nr:hypothetical protein [Methanosarcina sp.]
MKNDEIIFEDDERAAYIGTVTGWISRTGHFYGDTALNRSAEYLARYDGATHRKCNIHEELFRKNSYCNQCSNLAREKKYESFPEENWNGIDMLFSDSIDEYFQDFDSVLDYMWDNSIDAVEDLRLRLTDPQKIHELDPSEIYADLLPDDGDYHDIPREIYEAFDILNNSIRKADATLSWYPSKKKISKSDVFQLNYTHNQRKYE